jgi:hypothetical protein
MGSSVARERSDPLSSASPDRMLQRHFGVTPRAQSPLLRAPRSPQASLAPAVLASITRQIRALATNPPEGVRFYPSETSLTDIDASIDGPVDTPYHGGVFHLRLTLGPDYPAAPPKGAGLETRRRSVRIPSPPPTPNAPLPPVQEFF